MSKKVKKSSPPQSSSSSALSSNTKLFQNLLKTIQQFMSGKNYRPLSAQELMKRLHLPSQHSDIFNTILDQLKDDGHIDLGHQGYIWKQNVDPTVTGILRVHPRGFGFLRPDDPTLYAEDIFIPKHLTMNAVDGDHVEVIVNSEVQSEKGPEGKVVTILTRSRTHVAGIIREIEPYGNIYAYVPLLGMSQKVVVQSHPEYRLKRGDRVVMEVLEWGSRSSETLCRMSHYIGHISDPSCDIKAAIEEFDLQNEFPRKVIQEAKTFGSQVPRKEIAQREDLREWECFTIDPDTAKDFDDALSLTQDDQGNYHLGVHIADVSYYVQPGTALDREASSRCNSTYFPGYCLPMLPSELSNHLCSLKPDVNRLTVSVHLLFNSEGDLISFRISRSVIKSAKRFTYREAKEVLDGKKSRHAPTLQLMVKLCYLLKRKRYERDSIEFGMPELVVLVDESGVPTQLDTVQYDITHQMVEEFMLKANEAVAIHLSNLGKNLTYRVHDEPSEENMKDFAALASAFGYHLSEKPTPNELRNLFDEAMKTSYGQYLATSYIRRMRLALYSPNNIGHYGLGLTHYCHFTSPIRRYIDLVIHRILFGDKEERESLEIIALNCSEQERISAKAESNVVLLKKLRLLKNFQEAEPHRQYEAVITRVKPFGIFFEVLEFMLESFLHVSELEDDYYAFNDKNNTLKGTRYGKLYNCGNRFTVQLKEVDFISLESVWGFVSSNPKSEITDTTPKKQRSHLSHSTRKRKR
jgi:ribonuclease R